MAEHYKAIRSELAAFGLDKVIWSFEDRSAQPPWAAEFPTKLRTVIMGKVEGRLYDLSALANTLEIPVSTVHRKAKELEQAGLLSRERDGRSTYLTPTERACVQLDKSFEEMIATLNRLYRGTNAEQNSRRSEARLGERNSSANMWFSTQ